jgi:Na+-transporting NADH:ubiquinone oxidoreductase subunit NqrD
MNPGGMMILGALCAVAGLAMSIAGHDADILIFADGVLFGKGYGIWEERDG